MSLKLHVWQAATHRDWSIVFTVIVEKFRSCWSVVFRESNTAAFRPRLESSASVNLVSLGGTTQKRAPVSDDGSQRV
jgi:hypothetical protein